LTDIRYQREPRRPSRARLARAVPQRCASTREARGKGDEEIPSVTIPVIQQRVVLKDPNDRYSRRNRTLNFLTYNMFLKYCDSLLHSSIMTVDSPTPCHACASCRGGAASLWGVLGGAADNLVG